MEIKNFIKRVKNLSNAELSNLDLSSGEDLSIAIMNLISIEEHSAFSYMKTNDKKYFSLLNKTRELRKNLLERLVKNPKGEEWCISKHLLGASMRLIETGNKYLKNSKRNEAESIFKTAFEIYSLFWALNLGLEINELKDVAKKSAEKTDANDMVDTSFINNTKSKKWNIPNIFKKIIDCCKE